MLPGQPGSPECVPVTKLDAYHSVQSKINPVTHILARFQELTQTTGTAF